MKYYKAGDVDLVCIKNFANGDVLSAIRNLPTIEVSEDAISRENLIKSFLADSECKREEAKACMCSLDLMLELIEDAPSVVPQPKEGEWLPIIEGNEFGEAYIAGIYCSECGETLACEANYCPNCGCAMTKE